MGIFGTLLERRFGPVPVVLVFLLSGAAGAAVAVTLDVPPLLDDRAVYPVLGANGAALGLLCAWLVDDRLAARRGDERDNDLIGVYVVAAVLVLLSLAVVEANMGAALGGAAGRRPAGPGAAALHAQERVLVSGRVLGRAGGGGRAALSDPERFAGAERRVAAVAPQLQRILGDALNEGGWFGEAHESQLRQALAEPDPGEQASRVRTLLAEETRMGMLIGVAVGWELALELEQRQRRRRRLNVDIRYPGARLLRADRRRHARADRPLPSGNPKAAAEARSSTRRTSS